ncbi:MAG TPA: hypothetical protein PL195_03900 [bacterium]|nr:hypothetical protein [bacterium]HQJ59681.1 hypothetical protein [bacterium]
MSERILAGLILKNYLLFMKARLLGFDYLLNPETGELHRVRSNFYSSHNLHIADLEKFIGLTNVGHYKMEELLDGSKILVYDLQTGELIGEYILNKCRHCF